MVGIKRLGDLQEGSHPWDGVRQISDSIPLDCSAPCRGWHRAGLKEAWLELDEFSGPWQIQKQPLHAEDGDTGRLEMDQRETLGQSQLGTDNGWEVFQPPSCARKLS